jgi:tetratricopeptide (TPR) repeat protein
MEDRLRQLITLGREHYLAGEYEQAEPYLAEVVQEHRTFPDVFNMLGVIFHTQGRFGEAEEAFQRALELNPNYTEAALNLSVTYNDRGKYQEAREVYSKAISNSYKSPRSLDPFARGKIANMHADLAQAYVDAGCRYEAIEQLKKAVDLCPTFADLQTRLGTLYRDDGNLALAREHYEAAKLQNPRFVPARVLLGVTLLSLGQVEEATAEWREALEIDPEDRSAKMYLRMVEAQRSLRPPGSGPRSGTPSAPEEPLT